MHGLSAKVCTAFKHVQVNKPWLVGLALPRSYSHLLFKPTLALPPLRFVVGVPKVLLPVLDVENVFTSRGEGEP